MHTKENSKVEGIFAAALVLVLVVEFFTFISDGIGGGALTGYGFITSFLALAMVGKPWVRYWQRVGRQVSILTLGLALLWLSHNVFTTGILNSGLV